MKIQSPHFTPNGGIPSRFTCDDADTAPALQFTDVPKGAKSLALIVDDPDAPDPRAPKRTWVHWVVFNLPPTAAGLPEGGKLPAGAHSGHNDWKKGGYNGPCPPIGRHRYFFKLYALDVVLEKLGAHATKAELERAMEGHVLAEAHLIGTYEKMG